MANEVVVNIKADATKAKAAIGSFQDRVKKAADSVRRMGFAIGAVGSAVTFGFLKAASTTSIFQDRIGKLNVATGMSTDVLQGLAHAAQLGGVNLDVVDKSTRKMSKSIAEARQGMTEYLDAFTALGISMEELEGLSMDEAFAKIGDAIAEVKDPIDRGSLAMDVFGKSGQALIPLFKEGVSGAVNSAIQELKELNALSSGESVQAGVEYRDALTRLNAAHTGLKTTIGNALIPELTRLTDIITGAAKPIFAWIQANPELTRGIILLTAGIAAVMIPLGALMIAIPILTAMFTFLLGPVGLAIIAVVALVIAFKKFEIVRKIVKGAVEFILSYWEFMINGIIGGTNQFIDVLNDLLKRFPKLAKVIGTDFIEPLDDVSFSIDGLVGIAKTGFEKIGDSVKGLGSISKETFKGVVMSVEEMADVLTGEAEKVKKEFTGIIDAYQDMNDVLMGQAHHGTPEKEGRLDKIGDLAAIMALAPLDMAKQAKEFGQEAPTQAIKDLVSQDPEALKRWQGTLSVTYNTTVFGDTVQVNSTEETNNQIDKKLGEGING
jgi:hypothetical protein